MAAAEGRAPYAVRARDRARSAAGRLLGRAIPACAASADTAGTADTAAVLAGEVERLSEANSTLTRILGAIEEYVYSGEFMSDGSYELRFAGPCRERFLGLSTAAAVSAVWLDHVHPDEVAMFSSSHESAKVTGSLDIQYRLLGADGKQRWVRDRGRVRRVGDRLFLDGSVLDVTALRAVEQRLTEHVRDIEALGDAHREMALSADPLAARRAVCTAVLRVCGATAVGLYQPDGPNLVLVETDGLRERQAALPAAGSPGAVRAYRSGERTFVSDPAAGRPVSRPQPAPGAPSVLFEPVQSGGRTIGVIAVVWNDRVETLPPRVQALLPLLVSEAAVALERADLVDRLSVAAHTDPLTGLLNRRALDGLLPQALEQAHRGPSLCLAMLDLDRFKAYNDRHGHSDGDALLREAGQRWLATLRGSDTLIRFGGEEFLAVLPACDLPDAWSLMDALRRATPRGQTCSIGVVRWDGSETAAALLHRADQAMYVAKHAGRDQVQAVG